MTPRYVCIVLHQVSGNARDKMLALRSGKVKEEKHREVHIYAGLFFRGLSAVHARGLVKVALNVKAMSISLTCKSP